MRVAPTIVLTVEQKKGLQAVALEHNECEIAAGDRPYQNRHP